MIGQTLSHFKITAKLGEGGMGAVYRAEDSRLDREVAIKVLPEAFTSDAERLARFEREAKVLASLNHANIAAIYDLATEGETHFLVLELVEGESLGERIARGAIPHDEALPLALQIIDALDAAHARGIVHRDLKPANVMLTREGTVKVLDFGLAKAWEQDEASPDMTHSPTLTAQMTRAGVILGTAAYMSPEQARGEEADQRSDIWSFGVVLFEMLTGQQLFSEPTVSDTLAAVLRADLDLEELADDTPLAVRRTLGRCLARDPAQRLHAIADARLDLLEQEVQQVEAKESAATTGRRVAMLVSAAAALIAGLFLGSYFMAGSTANSRVGATGSAHVSIPLPADLAVGDSMFVLSPDGSVVAFEGQPRGEVDDSVIGKLYTRALGSLEVREVAGSEHGVDVWTFSPDSKWIALLHPVAAGSSRRQISKVPVDGSAPPLALTEWDDDWGTAFPVLWLPDGDILCVAGLPQTIVRIPSDGSSPRETAAVDFGDRDGVFVPLPAIASVLPDGRHAVGSFIRFGGEAGYDISVAMLDLETGEGRVLIDDAGYGQISATGHLVFSRGDALLATEFDAERLEPTGSPFSISTGLRVDAVWKHAYFNLADNGTLVHQPGGVVGGSRRLYLASDHLELLEPLSDDRRAFEGGLAVSPDGRRLAVGMVNDAGLYEVWVAELNRPRLSLFVREAGMDCSPNLWMPHSERLVVQCSSPRNNKLLMQSVEQSDGEAEVLMENSTSSFYYATSATPDGSSLILNHQSQSQTDVVRLPVAVTEVDVREPVELIPNARRGRVSPEGKWIAYISESSDRMEVYLRRLSGDRLVGPEIPVSGEGSFGHYWHLPATGPELELRYFNRRRELFSMRLLGDTAADLTEATMIENTAAVWPRVISASAMPDGRILLVLRGEDEEEPTTLSVVINWLSELERRTSEN